MQSLAKFLSVAVLLESTVCADHPTNSLSLVANSANFMVRSYQGGPAVTEVLERCGRLRRKLQRTWLGAEFGVVWRPRCEIVLHPTRAHYLQVVGRGGGQTSGSSLIQFENGRTLKRRIDLLVDEQGGLPALPHELTHVVLADGFGGRQPPRWVDEGIATSADTVEKRMLHYRDCQYALRQGTALRVIEVLRLDKFTSAQHVPAFYGQSLSLVEFLAEQDQPGKIVDFAEAAIDQGYDRALKQYYDIDGVAGLERQWREYVATSNEASRPVIPVSHRR